MLETGNENYASLRLYPKMNSKAMSQKGKVFVYFSYFVNVSDFFEGGYNSIICKLFCSNFDQN